MKGETTLASTLRRLRQLHDQFSHDRTQEISRAVDYNRAGNAKMAAYHTGLADARNPLLLELRKLIAVIQDARERHEGELEGEPEAGATVFTLHPGGVS